MRSYYISPIVLAFFVGYQWDSAVGIQVHARKMKIDWPVPQCKTFPAPIYIRVYVQLLDAAVAVLHSCRIISCIASTAIQIS